MEQIFIYKQNIKVLTCSAPSRNDASKAEVVVAVVRWKGGRLNIASNGYWRCKVQNGYVIRIGINTRQVFLVLRENHKR